MKNSYDILDMIYEDYSGGKKDKEYQVYCIQCVSYKRGLELIEELRAMGFEFVKGLPKDYHHVLVNLELGRVAGIPMPCKFSKNQIDLYEFEFKKILDEFLKHNKIGCRNSNSTAGC